jgi:transposase
MLERCEILDRVHPLVHEFLRLVRERDTAAYQGWRDAVRSARIPELDAFAGGLDRDEAAIVEAIRGEVSNGQTEGQVNRLKTLKRQMYGGGSFALLRKRVLYAA